MLSPQGGINGSNLFIDATTATLSGDLAVNGGDINSTSTTLTLGGSITTLNCADCIDFDDMEDTLDLDADLTINLGNNKEVTVNVDASFGGINGWTFNGTAAHTSI